MSEFEKRKEYLIRSLFHDSPDLSTIQEEYYDSSSAASPPLSLESHQSYSPAPPAAHCDGLWSPLPPLTIEKVKAPNKHDEPDDFYKRLHKKILKIYRRIFFEDRSDISDINTSDDDDEQTELIDYSTKSVELVEMTHQSVNDTSNDNNTSNNNEPIDYSTSRVEVVESTSQSVNNITADQENHEDITTAGTENQYSNEEEELQVNEPVHDKNESHDDNVNNNDADYYLPNLETIFECDERDLSNLEGNDDISSNLEANTESDERELPNIEPEETIIECDERDSSHSEADEDISPNLEANVESDEGDLPNIEPDDSDIPNLEANIESDDGRISSITDFLPNSTQSEESRDSVTPLSSTVILSRGTSDEKLCLERDEVSANVTHHILPEGKEIEGGGSSPQVSTVSEANPYEDVNMEIAMVATVSADATHHSDVDEMGERIRPSTGSVPRAKADPHKENENMETAMEAENVQTEETGTPRLHEGTPELHEGTPEPHEGTPEPHEGTPEPHEGTPNKDMEDNVAMDIDPDKSLQSEVEEMRTPRPRRTDSPIFQPSNKKPHIEPKIVIIEHHVSMETDISKNEEETPRRPNTIENPDNPDLFDLIRISSPKEITEGNTRIMNADENTVNMSSEDNSGDIPPEDNSGRNSPRENNRKRKSVSPCHSGGKKVRFADKCVQTDDFVISKTVQNIEINIYLRDRN